MTALERRELPGPRQMSRAEWFRPGNILWCSYWQHYDLVLAYEPLDGIHEVTVVTCDEQGRRIPGENERTHCTCPGVNDRLVGTIDV
jgi:hypothetical protein